MRTLYSKKFTFGDSKEEWNRHKKRFYLLDNNERNQYLSQLLHFKFMVR